MEWPNTIQRLHHILLCSRFCPTGIHWPGVIHWLHSLVHTGFPYLQFIVLSYHINEKCRSLWERLVKHCFWLISGVLIVSVTVCKLSILSWVRLNCFVSNVNPPKQSINRIGRLAILNHFSMLRSRILISLSNMVSCSDLSYTVRSVIFDKVFTELGKVRQERLVFLCKSLHVLDEYGWI